MKTQSIQKFHLGPRLELQITGIQDSVALGEAHFHAQASGAEEMQQKPHPRALRLKIPFGI